MRGQVHAVAPAGAAEADHQLRLADGGTVVDDDQLGLDRAARPGRPVRADEHRADDLVRAPDLLGRGLLRPAEQVEQAVEFHRDVGQLGQAPAGDARDLPDELDLEPVGEALVALRPGDELGRTARPRHGLDQGAQARPVLPEGLAFAPAEIGQAPVAELADQQRPLGPRPARGLPAELGQVPGAEPAVPVRGQQRAGVHVRRVGADPVVLDDRAGRVGVPHGVVESSRESLVTRPAARGPVPEPELVHRRPQHDGRMAAITPHLLTGGGDALLGDRAIRPELVHARWARRPGCHSGRACPARRRRPGRPGRTP